MTDAPKILAIETSSRRGSVALGQCGELLFESSFGAEQQHAGRLLPVMDQLVRQAGWRPRDINHVYVSVGPGSFTGLRIAVTAAKTLAFAQGALIVPVPSLEVAALNAPAAAEKQHLDIKEVAAIMDAKRRQIFAAVFACRQPGEPFTPGLVTRLPATLIAPAELLAGTKRPLHLLGEGLRYHGPDLRTDGVILLDEEYWWPRAADVLRCGWLRAQAGLFAEPHTLVPIYLRRPEAVEKWELLHGT